MSFRRYNRSIALLACAGTTAFSAYYALSRENGAAEESNTIRSEYAVNSRRRLLDCQWAHWKNKMECGGDRSKDKAAQLPTHPNQRTMHRTQHPAQIPARPTQPTIHRVQHPAHPIQHAEGPKEVVVDVQGLEDFLGITWTNWTLPGLKLCTEETGLQSHCSPGVQRIDEFLSFIRKNLRHLGTSYGGWTFAPVLLHTQSVIYSFGLGTDISWDLEIIKRIGCEVHGFDNTPVSNTWFSKQSNISPKFHRHPYLLSHIDETVELSLPTGFGVSYANVETGSALGFRQKTASVRLEARSVGSIMQTLNHSCIDVLKMGIESAEFKIFDEMSQQLEAGLSAHPLPVCQLLVEFHSRLHPLGNRAKDQAMQSLAKLGFRLLHNVVISADGSDNAFFVNPVFCLTMCPSAVVVMPSSNSDIAPILGKNSSSNDGSADSDKLALDSYYSLHLTNQCNMLKESAHRVRVAVGFFGLIRNIGPVLPSILINLLSPISEDNRVLDVFVHTLLLDKITYGRNGESNVALNKADFLKIPACKYVAEDQDRVDEIIRPIVKGVTSKREPEQYYWNYYRSRASMQGASDLISAHEAIVGIRYTHIVCARADVAYLSPIPWMPPKNGIVVPNFHQFYGVNDRFAMGDRDSMLDGYMNYEEVLNVRHVLSWKGNGYNTEGQACLKLAREKIGVGVIDICIVRVRSNGLCHSGDIHAAVSGLGECSEATGLNVISTNASSTRVSCSTLLDAMAHNSALLGLHCREAK